MALIIAVGAILAWILSAPRPMTQAMVPAHQPDLANGAIMYNIGGCISCHKPAADAAGMDAALPSGGAPLKTPVGTLYPPNLTPDPETGLGKWSDLDFLNAMMRGLAPSGAHAIPAFPYTSYTHMRPEDLLDLKAHLASLKPVVSPNKPADIPLPFLLRRGIGLWQWVGLDTTPWKPDPAQSESWNRGSYLVNAPGHCGECHTPRTFYMASDMSRFLMGGPHPEGEGRVPSLRDLIGRGRYKDVNDLASALQYGEIMGYDKLSSGGMRAVQANISKLPEPDIKAIAEYLASLK